MGPTVWELDGPIPILNKSKTLIAIADNLQNRHIRAQERPVTELLRSTPGWPHHPVFAWVPDV
jgi:hypothetical protein